MALVGSNKLQSFVRSAFGASGLDAPAAELATNILHDADLRGIDTHGVLNLSSTYVLPLLAGRINARPQLSFDQKMASTAVLNADNGLGLLAGHAAMARAIEMARSSGIGWVSVANSNHCGAGAFFVDQAVQAGMVGLHFSSGGTAVAAPGSHGRLLGNNVIALGAPRASGSPLIFDMAPTMAISNKARLMAWQGKDMPEGWLIDDQGASVTDPKLYGAPTSAVLPLGGADAHTGSHKGFGLLLLIDILGGMLAGDGGSTVRAKGAESHAFVAINIEGFVDPALFEGLMDQMVEKLGAAPLRKGSEPVRYPGQRGAQTMVERRENGIPIPEPLMNELRNLAGRLNIEFTLASEV